MTPTMSRGQKDAIDKGTLRGPDLARRIAVRDFLNKAIPGRGMCAYDSAVVAGNGIGALAFAGWLAQSPLFEGKVTVVAPPVVESRRLINGVSLRGRGIDFMSAALDTTLDDILEVTSGSADAPPVSLPSDSRHGRPARAVVAIHQTGALAERIGRRAADLLWSAKQQGRCRYA